MEIIDKFELAAPACKFKLQKRDIILASFAINCLSLALPMMTLQVYDRIMINRSVGTLSFLVLVVLGSVVLEAILRTARAFTVNWAGMAYEYTLSANAVNRYINADSALLEHKGSGRQIQSLSSFSALRDFYSGQTLITLVDIPFALLYLSLIYYLAGILVVVPIILIIAFFLCTWIIGIKLQKSLIEQGISDSRRYNFIIEALQGVHTIKSFGLEEIFRRRYERLAEDSSICSYKTSVITTGSYNLGILFSELMVIITITFGAPMVINHHFTTGTLIATILLANRLMQPIQKTLFLWNQFQNYRLSIKTAEQIFTIPQITRNAENKHLPKIGSIEVKDVAFGYGNNIIFSDINLKVLAPEVISIQGQNNSGKETLIKLISGIYKPLIGSILVDSAEVSDYNSEELLEHIAFINSESTIFHGTILENLTSFDEKKSKSAMEVAALLHIDKEIAALPKGYDTVLYDGIADSISPGIKQRINIARVMINHPKIILFNNADKGLDREGYGHLLNLLSSLKGKVAMILVTDDPNILQMADRHYFIEDGQLSEQQTKIPSDNNLKEQGMSYDL